LKQPGEQFRRGDILLELESDKINVEIPALEDGAIIRHLVLPGDKVAVDHPIAVIGTMGTSSTASGLAETQPMLESDRSSAETIETVENLPSPLAGKTRASPVARRTAAKLGLNLSQIRGTGPLGRVTAADVYQHVKLVPKPGIETVDVAGIRALRWGKPERGTCVLLHGFAGDPNTWHRTGEFLAKEGFEVIAFELPGHGSQPLEASSLEDLATDLFRALPNPPSGDLHLIGHSLGGALAVLIAAKASDRFASLTLLAPFGIGTYIDQTFLDGIVSVRTIDALEREVRKTTAHPLSYSRSALAAMLQSLPTDSLRTISQMMAQNGVQQLFLVPELEKMTLPIRVLFGRQDRIVRWQEALSLPGNVALHLFDTGHMLHWEEPSAVLPVLARFPVSERTGGEPL
jgi:pyruvate dehydrogenase E2 component (dihydrolipoamide acetyltransferase)